MQINVYIYLIFTHTLTHKVQKLLVCVGWRSKDWVLQCLKTKSCNETFILDATKALNRHLLWLFTKTMLHSVVATFRSKRHPLEALVCDDGLVYTTGPEWFRGESWPKIGKNRQGEDCQAPLANLMWPKLLSPPICLGLCVKSDMTDVSLSAGTLRWLFKSIFNNDRLAVSVLVSQHVITSASCLAKIISLHFQAVWFHCNVVLRVYLLHCVSVCVHLCVCLYGCTCAHPACVFYLPTALIQYICLCRSMICACMCVPMYVTLQCAHLFVFYF